jgi:hypothetical protein
MRSVERNREYINKYRFCKKVNAMKTNRTLCAVCFENMAETLHHINENHNDNRRRNLIPICKACHLEKNHLSDKLMGMPDQMPLNRTKTPQKQVLQPQMPNYRVDFISGTVTLFHNNNSNIRLRCNVSRKTLNFLKDLGWEKEAIYG